MTALSEKAEILARRVVGGSPEVAIYILKQWGKSREIKFCKEHGERAFLFELVVFYMHMVACVASGYLSEAEWYMFGDQFIGAVVSEMLKGLRKGPQANQDEKTIDTFHAIYNCRYPDYIKYRELHPGTGQPLKDTLYWNSAKSFVVDWARTTLCG